MATLAGNTIASTYPLLLKVDSNGLDGTLRAIQDGDATDSVLYLATDSALISGNGTKLYFFDADGGEHISADNAGNLTIAAGADTSDLITLDSTGSIVLNADGGQLQFHDGSTEIGVFENSSSDFVMESKAQDKDIIFKGNDGGSGITAMTIDMSEGGRIGIGTTAPAGLLEVENSSGNANVYITSADASNSRLYLGNQSDSGHGFIDYDHNTAMYFGTDGTTRLTILEAGNVGVGTASPDNLLQLEFADGSNTTAGNIADESVTGLVLTNTTNSNGNGTMIKMESNNGSNATAIGHIQDDATSAHMAFYTELSGTFSEKMRLQHDGVLVLKASTPTIQLQDTDDDAVRGIISQNSTVMDLDSDSDITFSPNNTEKVRFTSTGNAMFGGVTSQVNSSHFQYASTFGDNSYARVGFFNQAIGNDAGRGMAVAIGQVAGTSHFQAVNTELGVITFVGQGNDADYVGSSISTVVTTGGDITRSATGCDMIFSTMKTSSNGASERGRFTSSGTFTVREITGTASNNAGKMSTSNAVMLLRYSYMVVQELSQSWKVMTAFHGDGSNDEFNDVIFEVEGNGDVESDTGSYGTGASDYAEYFESKDGNAIAIGKTVKLDGGKVVVCEDGDTPMGVVRPKQGACSVIGNKAQHSWHSKWLKNDYDEFVLEDCTVTGWTDEKGEYHSYETDKIPSDVTVPDNAKVLTEDENGIKLERRKINPDYNSDLKYEAREKRDSWCLIGLLGQIPITKGQPVSSNWIKMKDVSDTVEMYFVK